MSLYLIVTPCTTVLRLTGKLRVCVQESFIIAWFFALKHAMVPGLAPASPLTDTSGFELSRFTNTNDKVNRRPSHNNKFRTCQ